MNMEVQRARPHPKGAPRRSSPKPPTCCDWIERLLGLFWVEWSICVSQRWYKQILLGPEVSCLFLVNVICMHLLISRSAIMKSDLRWLNGLKQLFTGFQDEFRVFLLPKLLRVMDMLLSVLPCSSHSCPAWIPCFLLDRWTGYGAYPIW